MRLPPAPQTAVDLGEPQAIVSILDRMRMGINLFKLRDELSPYFEKGEPPRELVCDYKEDRLTLDGKEFIRGRDLLRDDREWVNGSNVRSDYREFVMIKMAQVGIEMLLT